MAVTIPCDCCNVCYCCCVPSDSGPTCCDLAEVADPLTPSNCQPAITGSPCGDPFNPCAPVYPGSPFRTVDCDNSPVGGDSNPCQETISGAGVSCHCVSAICSGFGQWVWFGGGTGPCKDTAPPGGCT